MTTHSKRKSEPPIRSGREFCARYFPRSHAAKTCRCYPPQQGRLYILPRPGVNR